MLSVPVSPAVLDEQSVAVPGDGVHPRGDGVGVADGVDRHLSYDLERLVVDDGQGVPEDVGDVRVPAVGVDRDVTRPGAVVAAAAALVGPVEFRRHLAEGVRRGVGVHPVLCVGGFPRAHHEVLTVRGDLLPVRPRPGVKRRDLRQRPGGDRPNPLVDVQPHDVVGVGEQSGQVLVRGERRRRPQIRRGNDLVGVGIDHADRHISRVEYVHRGRPRPVVAGVPGTGDRAGTPGSCGSTRRRPREQRPPGDTVGVAIGPVAATVRVEYGVRRVLAHTLT